MSHRILNLRRSVSKSRIEMSVGRTGTRPRELDSGPKEHFYHYCRKIECLNNTPSSI